MIPFYLHHALPPSAHLSPPSTHLTPFFNTPYTPPLYFVHWLSVGQSWRTASVSVCCTQACAKLTPHWHMCAGVVYSFDVISFLLGDIHIHTHTCAHTHTHTCAHTRVDVLQCDSYLTQFKSKGGTAMICTLLPWTLQTFRYRIQDPKCECGSWPLSKQDTSKTRFEAIVSQFRADWPGS